MSHWIQQESKYLFQTYRRQPLVLVKGRGSRVWDADGREYLDFFSGLAVNNVGHCHPRVVRAIASQAGRLMHTSNLYYTVPQIELARELVTRSFPGRVFFSNSGAEANECAVKLARRWGKKIHHVSQTSKNRHEIIAFEASFHGRTVATLTLTGQEKYRRGFDPLHEKVVYARFNDIGSVRRLLTRNTCAVFIEPVQGEGGVHPAAPGFLRDLRKLCDRHHLLLVFDEVQTGMGRCGTLFAWHHYGVRPDVLTLAKGLGGGLPIGATVAVPKAADLFSPGDHASTFGGNPVAAAAALQVMKILGEPALKSVRAKSAKMFKALEAMKRRHPDLIREVRGLGLMAGVELSAPGDAAVRFCRENGLLVNCVQENTIRLLPPLTLSDADLNAALRILERSFDAMAK